MKPTNSPHILCVNPWIHDYAAFDFWIKPVGLLKIAALLEHQGANVTFIDCLDRYHPMDTEKRKTLPDGRGPYRKRKIDPPHGLSLVEQQFSRYGIDPEWFKKDLEAAGEPELVLVTSGMTYWAPGVKETIETIQAVYPGVPVMLGGIYATLWFEHARQYTGADIVISGGDFSEIFRSIHRYTGIGLPGNFEPENLDSHPYPAFHMLGRIPYVPLTTTVGCPFSCDYCASSYLADTFRRRSVDSVFREIEHWHHKYGVRNFAFYDDALLVDKERHALILFERIAASGLDVSFHTPNAVHVRELDEKTCLLMKKAGFESIRLGLETVNFSRNRTMDAKVIKEDFSRAVTGLKKAGFTGKQIGAYLLCGLPGQEFSDIEASFRQVCQTGITPTLAFYTPIPHTRMWETAVKHSGFDLESDPVYTNNCLFPCMPETDIRRKISRLKKRLKPAGKPVYSGGQYKSKRNCTENETFPV